MCVCVCVHVCVCVCVCISLFIHVCACVCLCMCAWCVNDTMVHCTVVNVQLPLMCLCECSMSTERRPQLVCVLQNSGTSVLFAVCISPYQHAHSRTHTHTCIHTFHKHSHTHTNVCAETPPDLSLLGPQVNGGAHSYPPTPTPSHKSLSMATSSHKESVVADFFLRKTSTAPSPDAGSRGDWVRLNVGGRVFATTR